jgi:dUTP pyrophosphatase
LTAAAARIQLKILDERIDRICPRMRRRASAGMDLRACIDGPLTIATGQVEPSYRTGYANPHRRSGARRIDPARAPGSVTQHGIVLGNLVGLIDSDYQGPLMVSCWNRSAVAYALQPMERLAQLVIVPSCVPRSKFTANSTKAAVPQVASAAPPQLTRTCLRACARSTCFSQFPVSAGLIYESIWAKYLKLFLGHAPTHRRSFSSFFIGGMAIGAALCAKFTNRIRHPLIAYAIVEFIVGVFAIGFHRYLVGATDWAYTTLLPATCDATSFCISSWALAAGMILPSRSFWG